MPTKDIEDKTNETPEPSPSQSIAECEARKNKSLKSIPDRNSMRDVLNFVLDSKFRKQYLDEFCYRVRKAGEKIILSSAQGKNCYVFAKDELPSLRADRIRLKNHFTMMGYHTAEIEIGGEYEVYLFVGWESFHDEEVKKEVKNAEDAYRERQDPETRTTRMCIPSP